MTTLIEAAQQALEALEADEQDMVADKDGHMVFRVDAAITALRQAIEQAEKQEPVTWSGVDFDIKTAPPPRQPFSDEQYEEIVEDLAEWSRYVEMDTAHQSLEKHVRQVLAAHGIKGEA